MSIDSGSYNPARHKTHTVSSVFAAEEVADSVLAARVPPHIVPVAPFASNKPKTVNLSEIFTKSCWDTECSLTARQYSSILSDAKPLLFEVSGCLTNCLRFLTQSIGCRT